MAKPPLFVLTLEDFSQSNGQIARLLSLAFWLRQWSDLTLAGRQGALPGSRSCLFVNRVELPLPAGVSIRDFFLSPRGPARLAALRRALASLPSTPETTLYADSALLAEMATGSPRARLVAELNGAIAEEFHQNAPRWAGLALTPFLRRWEAKAFLRCDRLIAVSQGVADYARGLAPSCADRVAVIGNGIDPLKFNSGVDGSAVRRAQGWGASPVGVFVSTFRPWHGARRLVEALPFVLRERPDFKLALVGDGPERARVQALAARLGLERSICFAGAVPAAAAPAWIAAADVGLYCPSYASRHGFLGDSIKLYEYMACGKPSVVARVSGLGDAVAQAGAGVFANPAPEAFARAIVELLADPQKAREMGERGARAAAEKHSWEAVARKIARACGIL
jgi:glycosyltransferase involved in cell wall biosynthesis